MYTVLKRSNDVSASFLQSTISASLLCHSGTERFIERAVYLIVAFVEVISRSYLIPYLMAIRLICMIFVSGYSYFVIEVS